MEREKFNKLRQHVGSVNSIIERGKKEGMTSGLLAELETAINDLALHVSELAPVEQQAP